VKVPDALKRRVNGVIERFEEIDAERERLMKKAIAEGRERLGKLSVPSPRDARRRLVARVEGGYEQGVNTVLGFLNVPTTTEVQDLNKRIDKLTRKVNALSRTRTTKAKRATA